MSKHNLVASPAPAKLGEDARSFAAAFIFVALIFGFVFIKEKERRERLDVMNEL